MTEEKIKELGDLLDKRDIIKLEILTDSNTIEDRKKSIISAIEKNEKYNIYGVLFDPVKLLSVFPEEDLQEQLELINKQILEF